MLLRYIDNLRLSRGRFTVRLRLSMGDAYLRHGGVHKFRLTVDYEQEVTSVQNQLHTDGNRKLSKGPKNPGRIGVPVQNFIRPIAG